MPASPAPAGRASRAPAARTPLLDAVDTARLLARAEASRLSGPAGPPDPVITRLIRRALLIVKQEGMVRIEVALDRHALPPGLPHAERSRLVHALDDEVRRLIGAAGIEITGYYAGSLTPFFLVKRRWLPKARTLVARLNGEA